MPAPGFSALAPLSSVIGGYEVQPADAVPPSTANERVNSTPPNRKIQNDKALTRGNAMSSAPICSGIA